MERYLTNLRAWAWEYPDSRLPYRGIHFTANRAACDALIRCLDTLAIGGGHRTIPLKPLDPADEAEILGGRPYRSLREMRLEYVEPSPDLQQMLVRGEGTRLLIRVTNLRFADLRAGLEDVRNGRGDYCILPQRDKKKEWTLGPLDRESEYLHFWPCFGHLFVTRPDIEE